MISALLWSGLALSGAATLVLLVYLDLRINALKQSGALSASAPQLFGFSRGLSAVGQTIDLPILYSRRYREIDGHTRALAPIVRVTLPLTPILLVAAVIA